VVPSGRTRRLVFLSSEVYFDSELALACCCPAYGPTNGRVPEGQGSD